MKTPCTKINGPPPVHFRGAARRNFFGSGGAGATGGANVNSRFLLIFDTSSDMRRRVPAVQQALNDNTGSQHERAVAFRRHPWRVDIRPGVAGGAVSAATLETGQRGRDGVEHHRFVVAGGTQKKPALMCCSRC